MTAVSFFFGDNVLLTGVEVDDEDPTLTRLYIGPRYHWIYVLCATEDAPHMGMGHTFLPRPGPEIPVYQDDRAPEQYRKPKVQEADR